MSLQVENTIANRIAKHSGPLVHVEHINLRIENSSVKELLETIQAQKFQIDYQEHLADNALNEAAVLRRELHIAKVMLTENRKHLEKIGEALKYYEQNPGYETRDQLREVIANGELKLPAVIPPEDELPF